MKKEIADQWVAALRSGKYKQASEHLKKGDSFCCLGVLCDITGKGEWIDQTTASGFKITPYSVGGDWNSVSLLPEVKEFCGMISSVGNVPSLGTSLATLNDDGSSFKQIADIIEQHWEEL